MQSKGHQIILCFGLHSHVRILSINYNFHINNTINFHQLPTKTKHPTPQNTFILIKSLGDKCCESQGCLLLTLNTE